MQKGCTGMIEQKKKSNVKIKPVPVIIAAVIVAAIVGVGVYALVRGAVKDEGENVQINLNQATLKPENATAKAPDTATTVEILLENTAIPVGTTIQVTALVTPEDTTNALSWSSSNSSVFTVSVDGTVTITGTGTAALTATIGTVSDAVVIEGIETVTSGSVNKYPVYTGGSMSSTGESGSGSDSGSAGGNSSGSDSGSAGGNSSGSDSGSAGGNSSGSDSGSTGGNSSDSSQGYESTEIGSVLPSIGFTQTMPNVYVCQENNTYYGEIITQPNVTICYIKQRSDGFDSKIISVLKELLPTEYNQVWSNYLSAATDRTFTAEGRRIRIVTASGGGHSQIVIYN